MSRASKGPRLWKRRKRRNGKTVRQALWIIKDGGKYISTGCVASASQAKPPREAEEALSAYIASKYRPVRKHRDIEDIDCADVLSIYHTDKGEIGNETDDLDERIGRLNEFWGGKMLSDVNSGSCGDYARHRGSAGGARRDLETFRAAINHHAKEGAHRGIVRVSLPQKGERRERWLDRSEAAQLIWACWRYREKQTIHVGANKGNPILTDRRPLRHVARFILIGIYTGTRAGSIATASPDREEGRSFVDLERGIFYRKAIGKKASKKKRQTPAPIPSRLLAHLRRWQRLQLFAKFFVEFNGKPIASVKKGFRSGVRLAGLSEVEGKITPHTLRHTAATWLMQRAAPLWEAAGFLGMSVEVLEKNYHPDHMQGAANAIGSKKRFSVVETVVSLETARERRQKA